MTQDEDAARGPGGFQSLMRHRVRRILFVSSLYDSFALSEDGRVVETLLAHFLEAGRMHVPDLEQVPDADRALARLDQGDGFDLVVSSVFPGEGDVLELASDMRAAGHDVPVIALGFTGREIRDLEARGDLSPLERVYLWQGDVRLFSSLVQEREDRLNLETDTQSHGVPAVLLVEDSVASYSSFLPAIHAEILAYTRRLLSDDLSLSQKTMRMRARPKVLLCTSYEEAWNLFERHGDHVLGVISDMEYPRGGQSDPEAGFELCRSILERRPDVRLVLQSSRPENDSRARELGASFLVKGAPAMLTDLRRILVERFGFGDFVFSDEHGVEIARVEELRELARVLRTIPAGSLARHVRRGELANWLRARTEIGLAEGVRALAREHADDPEALRQGLRDALHAHHRRRATTVIAEFDRDRYDREVAITRIGWGPMGGKARGLSFVNQMLAGSGVAEGFPGVDVHVPPCVVLGTGVFDEFLRYGFLHEFAAQDHPYDAIERMFLQAPFPREAGLDLRAYLQRVKGPLSVRSSSLMEDSRSQPFAGIYDTFMLPNEAYEVDVRFRQLVTAVQRVYASAFSDRAKAYMAATGHQLDEEKMGVVVQRLVGRERGNLFYPDFGGVARSHNYYPEPGQSAEDGVAAVALGMGRAVVGGEPCLRFCPRYPRHIVGISSVQEALRNTQREFLALDLGEAEGRLSRRPLTEAEDGPLPWLGSTYVASDDRIVPGIARDGVRLVTFSQVLEHDAFPLAGLLSVLLERCAEQASGPVEIEFAGNLGDARRRAEFAVLQLRPMPVTRDQEAVRLGAVDVDAALCHSERVLGNGRIGDTHDVVVVDRAGFERRRTPEVAQEVARFDARLRKEGRPYVLIGVGRWGSTDPSLGIPVSWGQIAGARAIVEAGFEDFVVAPSQGTHFFQNLTSGNVGYFTVNPDVGQGRVDWDWLAGIEPLAVEGAARLLRFEDPVVVEMDGRSGEGVIHKPGAG